VYVKPTTARALFDASGRLRALVADGEETDPLAFLDVPEGSEPLTREQITAALAELSDDELSAVIDAAVAEGQAIGASDDPITPEVLARINALADAREAAEAQIAANATAAEEAQRARDEALARLTRPEGTGDAGDGDGDEDTHDGDAGGRRGRGPPTGSAPEPVTAAAPRRTRPNTASPAPGSGPAARPPPPRDTDGGWTAPAAQVALVAAAGLDSAGLASGATIDTAQQLGEAFNAKRHALRGTSGGDGEQITVASVRTTYPDDRYLSETDPDGNTRNLTAATSPKPSSSRPRRRPAPAGTSSPPGCAPPSRSSTTCRSSAPPPGPSGTPSPTWAPTAAASSGGSTCPSGTSPGPPASGPGHGRGRRHRHPAGPEAVPGRGVPRRRRGVRGGRHLLHDVLQRHLPVRRRVHRRQRAGRADRARPVRGEPAHDADRRPVHHPHRPHRGVRRPGLPADPGPAVRGAPQLLPAGGQRRRSASSCPAGSATPSARTSCWAPGSPPATDLDAAFAAADALITGWFTQRNVNVTWHLDGRPATTAGAGEVGMANQFYAAWADNGAVPDFPAQVEALMWVEGEMIHLDGGTLDLGVVRDSTLNQNNRYKQFSETWEGVAHRGVESIRLVAGPPDQRHDGGHRRHRAILAA
jgi:hypothetical protein